jgi:hypothetical protein
VEELGAGRGAERVEALREPGLQPLVHGSFENSLPSGPDPGYRGENPEEAGRAWNYL